MKIVFDKEDIRGIKIVRTTPGARGAAVPVVALHTAAGHGVHIPVETFPMADQVVRVILDFLRAGEVSQFDVEVIPGTLRLCGTSTEGNLAHSFHFSEVSK